MQQTSGIAFNILLLCWMITALSSTHLVFAFQIFSPHYLSAQPTTFRMAQFGAFYVNTNCKIPKEVVLAYPMDACSPLQNHSTYVDESNSENHYKDKLVLVTRGQCAFIQKALYVEQAGAAGMIVVNSENGEMHLMSDDGTDAGNLIRIPCVLIPYDRGQQIMYYMELRNQEIEREKQREVKMQNVPTSPNMDNLFSSIWIRPKVTAALGYCSTLDFHFF